MSHNVSRNKQDEMARSRRVAELKAFLAPGWQVDPSQRQIVAVRTVLGFDQRGQQMLLRCRRPDCHRRVEVDFREAVQQGKGDLPPDHLIHLLRCDHWGGCRLQEVSAIYPKGVPLVGFLNEEDLLIAITCDRCTARLLLPPRAIIPRLREAGTGDGSTGVLELGSRIRGPCRKCGGRTFSSEVIRPKAPGT